VGELLGHMATNYTTAIPNLNWDHYFRALMEGTNDTLPTGLNLSMEFLGESAEPTTYAPRGSAMFVYVLFAEEVGEVIIDAVVEFLRGALIVVTII